MASLVFTYFKYLTPPSFPTITRLFWASQINERGFGGFQLTEHPLQMKALYVDKEDLVGHMTMIFTVSCLPLQVYMPENPVVTSEAEQLI